MPHVLTICTANICRSPLVAAYLRHELDAHGMTGWAVSSAGTWAEQERGAARYTIDVAAEKGLDLTDHRARMVTREMLAEADLVLCMTAGHAEALRIEFPADAHKVFLLSEMVGRRYDISDPYGGPRAGYEQMSRETERLVREGFGRITDIARARAATR